MGVIEIHGRLLSRQTTHASGGSNSKEQGNVGYFLRLRFWVNNTTLGNRRTLIGCCLLIEKYRDEEWKLASEVVKEKGKLLEDLSNCFSLKLSDTDAQTGLI